MPLSGLLAFQNFSPAEFAAAPFDVKVIDVYNGDGDPWTLTQVDQMDSGPDGAPLLGYLSIGEAESCRPFFDAILPSVLGPELPDWSGCYEVAYWTAEWRAVTTALIDALMLVGTVSAMSGPCKVIKTSNFVASF